MDISEVRAAWRAVLPTQEDFNETIPFMWHPALQILLPPGASSLVENQRNKISVDWAAVSTAFSTLSYASYLYYWFIVSTRTFYYTSPKIKTPVDHYDCLALAPFADCFNHADVASSVTFSTSGYEVCTDRRIEKGGEIYISYGNHSNDFLLAEYGFILDENKWDEISIDEVILPLFTEELKQQLREAGFLGNFVLDREKVCYRTQVTLRLLFMPPNRWQFMLVEGLEDEDEHQLAVNKILVKGLKAYLDIASERIKQVELLDCGLPSQRCTLNRRWEQICLLLTSAITRIERNLE